MSDRLAILGRLGLVLDGDSPTAPPSRREVALVALFVFVLAFAVSIVWLLEVQSPFGAVYSDMAGYVERAQLLLDHKLPADPRVLTLFPPGAHGLVALEFLVLGRTSRHAIAIAHALVGALPAPCMAVLTPNLVPKLWASGLVGTLVALWLPQACFVSYFSTELWFSAAITVHAVLTVRDWKRPVGKLALGVAAAIAFVVRPQFQLTLAIELGARGLRLLWERGPRAVVQSFAWVILPVVLTMSLTSVRFHRLTGHWGLISESCINRLWADTDICGITSTWKAPNGETLSYWFTPPSKAVDPCEPVHFDGYIADPELVNEIRVKRMSAFTLYQRVRRKLRNVKLLVMDNLPWPEIDHRSPIWRLAVQMAYADAFLNVVLPLALAGALLGRRNRTMLIIMANMVTVIVAAAFFFGEARYAVPYAPMALLLAVTGAYEILGRLRRLLRRLRGRGAAARGYV